MKKNILNTSAIILSACLAFSITSGCQKPAQRPAILNEKISGNIFEIQKLNSTENTQSEEVINSQQEVIQKCISLVKNEEQKKVLIDYNSHNRLTLKIAEGQISLVVLNSNLTLQKDTESTEKSTEPTELLLATFKISTGVLENELTDYNEKKSILGLTPKKLSESTHFTIESQLTEEASQNETTSLDL